LRNDLTEIVRIIKERCPRVHFVVSTNGLLTQRIVGQAGMILEIDSEAEFMVSIDGLEATHNRIRRVKDAYRRALDTVRQLRDMGANVGIAMTLMVHNVRETGSIFQLSRDLGVEFSVTVPCDSDIFFGEGKSDLRPQRKEAAEHLLFLIREHYRSWTPLHWARAWYEKGLIRYLEGNGRPLRCDAGSGFFYLDALGNVYPCHLIAKAMGNIRERSWKDIWLSNRAEEIRERVEGCEKCWMACTGLSAAERALGRIIKEVVADKARVHLGRAVGV